MEVAQIKTYVLVRALEREVGGSSPSLHSNLKADLCIHKSTSG